MPKRGPQGILMRIGLVGVGRIGAFHAGTLRVLPGVDSLVVTDADPGLAQDVAGRLGVEATGSVAELLGAGLDGLVIASATGSHPELIKRAVQAGLPVFCEKPVAPDVEGTLEVIKVANSCAKQVQVGFQRRFDVGFRAARDAARSGSLGWLHTVRSTTFDAAPPPPGYIPGSGGIFRDCAVHDFDVIRWVTGREVTQAYAVGANRGEDFFRASGDVDTACAVLTLDDGTLATVNCGRYNAAGYDVRLEVLGSAGSVAAGLDERMPLRSAEPGVSFPVGPAHHQFMERFGTAYAAELAAFTEVVAGRLTSPCTLEDALEGIYVAEACELSRQRNQPVLVAEVRR
jgi:myo-inositol 2-dehydrogenase / D-chiro-inositol 1-dehydrogenase